MDAQKKQKLYSKNLQILELNNLFLKIQLLYNNEI